MIITIKRFFSITTASIILVIINKIIECFVLINIGAELNMIITDVIDKAGLTMRIHVKIKISSYSEYISRFLKIIENMLISVGLVAYRVNIFVTRLAPQSLVLGMSYLHSARAQLLFDDDSM